MGSTHLWLAGNEGMEGTRMGYIRTSRRIHSFTPS